MHAGMSVVKASVMSVLERGRLSWRPRRWLVLHPRREPPSARLAMTVASDEGAWRQSLPTSCAELVDGELLIKGFKFSGRPAST